MKIDFDVVLKNIEGKVFKGVDDGAEKDLTLKDACIVVLTSDIPIEEPRPDGAEKFKRYELAVKLKTGGVIDIPSEEVAKVKRLIGLMCQVQLVGACYNALEGNN